MLYEPAGGIGGDFYDILPIGPDYRCILIGDASGHEVPSGIVMAVILGFIWGAVREGSSPAEIVRSLNTFLIDHQERAGTPDLLATLFLGFLDTRNLTMCCINAGHPPPILQRAAGGSSLIDPSGLMLGVDPHAAWVEHKFAFDAGDRLFLATDGLTDAILRTGGRLEAAGLLESVTRDAGASADVMLEHIRELLAETKPSERDDWTAVVLTFHGRTSTCLKAPTDQDDVP
ncbi:MAG: PP2C family protein-serine/threonine phosphatase [Phycisphaerales bacterium]